MHHYIRRQCANHVVRTFPPPQLSCQVHETTTFSIDWQPCFNGCPDTLAHRYIGLQVRHVHLRKSATDEQAIHIGQGCVFQSIKRDNFRTG